MKKILFLCYMQLTGFFLRKLYREEQLTPFRYITLVFDNVCEGKMEYRLNR
jgi:hypothetical protein